MTQNATVHRRPILRNAKGEALTGSERKAEMQRCVKALESQIDLYTSKQGLTHLNIRYIRELQSRIETEKYNEGHARYHYFNNYYAIVRIDGKFYIGSIEYGSARSRKEAREIAFKRAMVAAFCGEESTEAVVENLRFSRGSKEVTVS